jgi:GntR family transcriptional regulator
MKIKFDKDSAVPYYHQVKLAVKSLIATDRLRPGDMLPSELALSEQLGISRLVVHRAFRELVTEGLLVRKRAKGTFVAPPVKRSYTVVGPLLSMTELTRDGVTPESHILKQEVVPAPPVASMELHLAEEAAVVHIYTLRLVEGMPLAVEDLYFPADRFPALATMDLNNRSVYSTLERVYDAHPEEAVDLVSAGAATRDEARLLGINTGAPVMRVQRTSTDRKGLPVEFSKVVFHAERYHFGARVRRTSA